MRINSPKKSLGQNFLIDKNIIDIIINAGDVKKMIQFLKQDQELEI